MIANLDTSIAPRTRVLFAGWILLRVLLVSLLLYAFLRSDLPQFQAKAMPVRLVLYPLATLIVPVGWWIRAENKSLDVYPWLLDYLVALPTLIDAAGNALDLYNSIWWWDDFNHFLNPFLLSLAIGLLLLKAGVGRITTGALVIGFGAILGILWEFAEYLAFVRRSPEFNSAYEDTLGDLALDLAGCTLAAIILVTWLSHSESDDEKQRQSQDRATSTQ